MEEVRKLKKALAPLEEAFLEGESIKTGLIALLKKGGVAMANEIAVTLRIKGWVCNDKDKETGRMSYIFWNGPRLSLDVATQIREETLERRRKKKKERKKAFNPAEEIVKLEARRLELQEELRELNTIINYLNTVK